MFNIGDIIKLKNGDYVWAKLPKSYVPCYHGSKNKVRGYIKIGQKGAKESTYVDFENGEWKVVNIIFEPAHEEIWPYATCQTQVVNIPDRYNVFCKKVNRPKKGMKIDYLINKE